MPQKSKPSITSRANFATAVVVAPLLLVAALDFVLASRVETIRDLVVEETLPVTLNTMQMRWYLQHMNSNLLEFVLGDPEDESEYYENMERFKSTRKLIDKDALQGEELEEVDRLLFAASKRAKKDVFSFDSSSIEKILPRVQHIIQSYIVPLDLMLQDQEASILLNMAEKEELIKAYALNREMHSQLKILTNSIKLLTAKSSEASSDFIIGAYKFELALMDLSQFLHSPSSKVRIEKIQYLLSKINEEGTALLEESDIEGYYDAVLAIEEIQKHYLPESDKILGEISNRKRLKVESSLDDLQKAAKSFEQLNALAVGFAISLTIAYLFYLRQTIIAPIRRISEDVGSLRNGHRNLHFSDNEKTREISHISNNLGLFQQELIELDSLRTEQIDQVHKQHLSELQEANLQLHQLILKNEEANARLITVNRDLAQFVHIASHDLREPLKKLGSLCTLLDEDINAIEQESGILELTNRISKQAASASRLIEDLRLLASLDQDSINIEKTNLDGLVKDVINELSPQLEGRVSSIDIATLPKINVSRNLFRQVFFNLIDNAILHSNGAFFLTVTAILESDEEWIFSFSNSTNEVHIDHSRLLLPFVQGSKNEDGTGIGLAICKRIIELHGGSLWIEDPEDNKFVINIKLRSNIPLNLSNGDH